MEKLIYTAYNGRRSQYRAEQKARQRKRRIRALKAVCGWTAAIMFILILGKAGASDCGAAWEEIWPSTLYYTVGFVLSFMAWEKLDQI